MILITSPLYPVYASMVAVDNLDGRILKGKDLSKSCLIATQIFKEDVSNILLSKTMFEIKL